MEQPAACRGVPSSARATFALLATSCALVAGACGPPDGPQHVENAILITLDTTRADVLGCYGGPSDLTPNLDRLAGEGLCYLNARTVAPLTLPAHASMLTGLNPPRHTLRDNGLRPLPSSAQTVAELCRTAGIETAAFVSAAVLDHAFGLDQGFDIYDQPGRPSQQTDSHYSERPANHTVTKARAWLMTRDQKRRFFLWVHLFDPHVPYLPPREHLEQARGDAYRGEVAFADAEIGKLLEAARADGTHGTTLVIVTADHGESLGAHGEPTHGAFCYDATLRVPLIVRHPNGWRAGETSQELVSVIDIGPTLVEALGVGSGAAVDGLSLFGREVPEDRGVYCESYSGFLNFGWSPLAGWVSREAKYLHSSSPEFYDLAQDPSEETNRIGERGDTEEAAKRALAELLNRPALQADVSGTDLPEELRRDLKSLGYAALGAEIDELPHPLAPSDRPSPRERARELEPLLIASALGDTRSYADAILPLQTIVRENPRHALALDLLAFDLMQLSRFAEAQVFLQQRLALGLSRADTHLNLASCLERQGRVEGARRHFERAVELDPENAQALEALVRISQEAGQPEQAAHWRQRLESLGPGPGQ